MASTMLAEFPSGNGKQDIVALPQSTTCLEDLVVIVILAIAVKVELSVALPLRAGPVALLEPIQQLIEKCWASRLIRHCRSSGFCHRSEDIESWFSPAICITAVRSPAAFCFVSMLSRKWPSILSCKSCLCSVNANKRLFGGIFSRVIGWAIGGLL